MFKRAKNLVAATPALISTLFASTYYVANNGSDSNPGTLNQPFATIAKGVSKALSGDTVYIRGGTYHERVYTSRSGTASAPITFAGYPGETAIVDGNYSIPGAGSGLVQIAGNYTIVRDLTVQNSYYAGLLITGNYDQVLNVKTQKNNQHGVWVSGGSYALVQNCQVYYNSYQNQFGASSPWAAGVSLRNTTHATARQNKIWNNWGEGLSSAFSSYTTLEDNTVWDNFATSLYFNRVQNSLIQRNLVYTTSSNPTSGYGQSTYGILMGDEGTSGTDSSGNTIINNFVLGGTRAFSWWGSSSGGGFVNSLVAGNTFVSNSTTTAPPLKIANGPHSGSRIEDNVVVADATYAVADVPTSAGLTFSHNLWSKGAPSTVSGSGDVIGDPLLVKTGSTTAGSLSPNWFKLLSSSPAIGKGIGISQLKEDFFSTVRPPTPDIGGHEYTATSSTSDTAPPTAPTGLVATAVSFSQINLSWNASTDNVGVIGYRIYRGGTQIASIAGTSYYDTGLRASTSNTYIVAAYDAAGNASAQSAPATATTFAASDTTAPSVPTGLTATAASSSQINLSWAASTDNVGVSGYRIYRGGVQIASVSSTSYQNTGLSASTPYTYTVAAYDAAGNVSAQSPSAAATTLAQAANGQAVTSFTLINADTDQPIATLNTGAVLNLSTLPTRNLNVRANTSPSIVGSVVFVYDGKTQPMQTSAPYAAFDDANGNYYAWTPTVGSHVLKATPYSGANATGTAGAALTISFTVANSFAVTSFTLMNADTDMPIGVLNNGAVLNLATLPTRNLNVRADTSPSTVGSVVFVYDGTREPMQNTAPYAAFDDSNGNYYAWTPVLGSHVLNATPYTGTNATGSVGVSLTINFTVTNQ